MVNQVRPLERLAFLFECREYPIREENRHGYVVSDRDEKRFFTIINGVCRPDEVQDYFNTQGIGRLVLDNPLFEVGEPVEIHFHTPRCGF